MKKQFSVRLDMDLIEIIKNYQYYQITCQNNRTPRTQSDLIETAIIIAIDKEFIKRKEQTK